MSESPSLLNASDLVVDAALSPIPRETRAGDVVLFINNALHRAVPPWREFRDVLTCLLLPNPIRLPA